MLGYEALCLMDGQGIAPAIGFECYGFLENIAVCRIWIYALENSIHTKILRWKWKETSVISMSLLWANLNELIFYVMFIKQHTML